MCSVLSMIVSIITMCHGSSVCFLFHFFLLIPFVVFNFISCLCVPVCHALISFACPSLALLWPVLRSQPPSLVYSVCVFILFHCHVTCFCSLSPAFSPSFTIFKCFCVLGDFWMYFCFLPVYGLPVVLSVKSLNSFCRLLICFICVWVLPLLTALKHDTMMKISLD